METRGYYLTVGIFVIAILVGGVFFAIWLSKSTQSGLPYSIFFRSSVTGLNEGNNVIYQGVPIGKVSKISVDRETPDQVRVDVTIDDDFPVRADAYAQLEMKGITGGLLVQIKGGSKDSPILTHGKDKMPPIIQSRPSNIEELFTSAPKLVKNFADVGENLKEILSSDNRKNISDIIESIKDVTGSISRKTKSVEGFIDEAYKLFERGSKFVQNFDKEISSVSVFFKDTLKSIKDASIKVGLFSNEAHHLVKENRPGIQDFTSTGLYEFSQLLTEMRDLVVGIGRLTKKIENSRFLFGDPSKGVEAK